MYVPQDHIVYLSELFFANQFLFINDGYGLDWLKALDAVDALGADIFVPGHGPIPADPRETRQELRRFRQMLVDIRDAVQKEVAHGARRIKQSEPSGGPSMKKCSLTTPNGKRPFGDCTSN